MSDSVIPLTQGRVTLVDPDDFTVLSQFRWYLKMLGTPGAEKPYAARNVPGEKTRQVTLLMHRVISNAPNGVHVDHINGDSLDNRRENLRFSTQSRNAQNRKMPRTNTSGFKGVYPHAGKWVAKIQRTYLGHYATPEEAAHVYDTRARQVFGEFARLNFPDDTTLVIPATKRRLISNPSGFIGVWLNRKSGKWGARLTRQGMSMNLGFFDTAEEASLARSLKLASLTSD